MISVTGRAKREVVPDEFWLSITLSEQDSKGRVPLSEQQERLVELLRAEGVDLDQELRVVGNSSDYFRRGQTLSTVQYELKVDEVKRMWTLFRALSSGGFSEVELQRVAYSGMEELCRELRREAVLNARACAEELASALGQQVGRCLYIQDWNNTPSIPRSFSVKRNVSVDFAEFAEESMDSASAEADFQSVTLSYQVETRFLLE